MGIGGDEAYFEFLEDVKVSKVAKMYLKSDQENDEGEYDLLLVMLFVDDGSECSEKALVL